MELEYNKGSEYKVELINLPSDGETMKNNPVGDDIQNVLLQILRLETDRRSTSKEATVEISPVLCGLNCFFKK